jgi:hypothetical protein
MRRLAVVVPTAVIGLVLGASVSFADQPGTVGGCSAGYDLMTVQAVNDTLTEPGYEPYIIAKDATGNNDGYLCIHVIPNDGGPKKFDPAFVYTDNHTGR